MKIAGRILRGDNIKVEGKFQLGSTLTKTTSQVANNVHSGEPQVRVIENNSEFTIIEVTCSCGTKTSVKCEHVTETAESPTEQVAS